MTHSCIYGKLCRIQYESMETTVVHQDLFEVWVEEVF